VFGNSKYNALGGFAILSLMTSSAIEKVYNSRGMTRLTITSSGLNYSIPTTLPTPFVPYINGTLALAQTVNITDDAVDSTFIEGIVDFGRNNGSAIDNSTAEMDFDDPILSVLDRSDDRQPTESEKEKISKPIVRVAPPPDLKPIHIATAIAFLAGIFQVGLPIKISITYHYISILDHVLCAATRLPFVLPI